jgi:RHS repeat-associated protein
MSLDAVDTVFARMGSDGSEAWYLGDHLGSERGLMDNTGTLRDSINYDAFGNATESNPSYGDRFKWTGQEFDSSTKLQLNGMRYYDPATGRWTSQDPLGFGGGDANLYRAFANSPTNMTDPSGLDFISGTSLNSTPPSSTDDATDSTIPIDELVDPHRSTAPSPRPGTSGAVTPPSRVMDFESMRREMLADDSRYFRRTINSFNDLTLEEFLEYTRDAIQRDRQIVSIERIESPWAALRRNYPVLYTGLFPVWTTFPESEPHTMIRYADGGTLSLLSRGPSNIGIVGSFLSWCGWISLLRNAGSAAGRSGAGQAAGAMENAEATTSNVIRFGPHMEGPLPAEIANTFRGGSYSQVTLQSETTLYRVSGGTADSMGGFWTRTPPQGPVQAQIDLALNPQWGNTAQNVTTIRVPAGTVIYEGAAATQGGLLGGGSQVYIPKVQPGWVSSTSVGGRMTP